jgi:hypothetical protein
VICHPGQGPLSSGSSSRPLATSSSSSSSLSLTGSRRRRSSSSVHLGKRGSSSGCLGRISSSSRLLTTSSSISSGLLARNASSSRFPTRSCSSSGSHLGKSGSSSWLLTMSAGSSSDHLARTVSSSGTRSSGMAKVHSSPPANHGSRGSRTWPLTLLQHLLLALGALQAAAASQHHRHWVCLVVMLQCHLPHAPLLILPWCPLPLEQGLGRLVKCPSSPPGLPTAGTVLTAGQQVAAAAGMVPTTCRPVAAAAGVMRARQPAAAATVGGSVKGAAAVVAMPMGWGEAAATAGKHPGLARPQGTGSLSGEVTHQVPAGAIPHMTAALRTGTAATSTAAAAGPMTATVIGATGAAVRAGMRGFLAPVGYTRTTGQERAAAGTGITPLTRAAG